VARGGNNALSMIAVGPRGSLQSLPDMYMRQMAIGPRARGHDVRGGLLQRFTPPAREHHVRAAARQVERDRAPQPGTATGHQRHPATMEIGLEDLPDVRSQVRCVHPRSPSGK